MKQIKRKSEALTRATFSPLTEFGAAMSAFHAAWIFYRLPARSRNLTFAEPMEGCAAMSAICLQAHQAHRTGPAAKRARREPHLVHRLVGTCAPLLRSTMQRLATWTERSRQRRELARLSYRDLRDIGLSRHDVESELRKPFWR
jgi:uncharacterized protein YjiS (DUF1127 family)